MRPRPAGRLSGRISAISKHNGAVHQDLRVERTPRWRQAGTVLSLFLFALGAANAGCDEAAPDTTQATSTDSASEALDAAVAETGNPSGAEHEDSTSQDEPSVNDTWETAMSENSADTFLSAPGDSVVSVAMDSLPDAPPKVDDELHDVSLFTDSSGQDTFGDGATMSGYDGDSAGCDYFASLPDPVPSPPLSACATQICDDGDICTKEWCDLPSGKCKFQSNPLCKWGPHGDPCKLDGDCQFSDACYVASCEKGKCALSPDAAKPKCCSLNAPSPEWFGPCDDGHPCSVDECSQEVGENWPTCKSKCVDQCCTVQSGCNDGDPCSLDTCLPDVGCGSCVHKKIPGCCTQDVDCTVGEPCVKFTCNVAIMGCEYAAIEGCCVLQ